MADSSVALSGEIRKLRKKLRQIENLEQLDRELTDQEHTKISSKSDIRAEVQWLVSERKTLQKEEQKMAESVKTDSRAADPAIVESEMPQEQEGVHSSSLPTETHEQVVQEISTTTSFESPENTSMTASTSTIEPLSLVPPSSVLQAPASSTQSLLSLSASSSSSSSSPHRLSSPKPSAAQQKSTWKEAKFSVKVLEGHNDIICAVDCWESMVISGSRDTMLKLWDADTGRELRSMGGHTGSVTSVRLVPYLDTLSDDIPSLSSLHQCLAVTGSKDCSIRLWSLTDGQLRRSIYTYSSVECLDYHKGLTVSGSEGGKVELWNMDTGDNVRSIKGHDDAVTSIKFQDGRIVSGSASGVVKIWDVRDGSLHPVFDSSKTEPPGDVSIKRRHIRCLATCGDNVYWGDNGVNIKVLDINSGRVRKIRNHVDDFGSTNAMLATSTCLVSAGYDIDRGNSYLNVRSLPSEEYIATIDDNSTDCVTCLARAQVNREGVTLQRLCTGGSELKLWSQLPAGRIKKRTRSESEESFVTSKHIRRYSEPNMSDTESSEDDSDDECYGADDGDGDDDDDNVGVSSRSWCTIC